MQDYLSEAHKAADKGAEVLLKHWGKLSAYDLKSSISDLVTVADKESEEEIFKSLRTAFPDHAFLGEETGASVITSDYVWIVDPLDGTTNYTHQYPMISISIALWHKNEPVVGVVFNPIFNERFHAEKGKGAFLNNQKIKVSATEDLNKSLLATGFAYDRLKTPETNYKEFTHFTHLTHGVRRLGSAAIDLCYVAAGRLDGYWERGLKPWDVAAGALIVTEAGGKVTSYDQTPFKLSEERILATNGAIHEKISNELKQFRINL